MRTVASKARIEWRGGDSHVIVHEHSHLYLLSDSFTGRKVKIIFKSLIFDSLCVNS